MSKDNLGLVAYAKKALAEKWGYVWGTFGQLLTSTLLASKIKQYPDGVGGYKDFIQSHWLNRKVTDCVGLIKSYIWFNGSVPVYNSATDTSADGMYSRAKEGGPISSMPNIPGICVWKKGHIGVYIGGGQVIEAHGTKFGVIQTPLKGAGSTPWTHWLKCPYISYVVAEQKPEPTLNFPIHMTANIQDIGIVKANGVNDCKIGTEGKSKRLEMFSMTVDGVDLSYSIHEENVGDTGAKREGEVIGSIGISKRIEGITISVTKIPAGYKLQYRGHIEGIGTSAWCSSGQFCGTKGQSKRLEEIEVRIIKG